MVVMIDCKVKFNILVGFVVFDVVMVGKFDVILLNVVYVDLVCDGCVFKLIGYIDFKICIGFCKLVSFDVVFGCYII